MNEMLLDKSSAEIQKNIKTTLNLAKGSCFYWQKTTFPFPGRARISSVRRSSRGATCPAWQRFEEPVVWGGRVTGLAAKLRQVATLPRDRDVHQISSKNCGF